jgi:hypothetical protein
MKEAHMIEENLSSKSIIVVEWRQQPIFVEYVSRHETENLLHSSYCVR